MLATTPANAVTVRWNTCADGSDTGSTCGPGGLQPSATSSSGTGVNQTFSFQAIGDPSRVLTAPAFSTTNAIAPYGVVIKLEIGIFEGSLGAGTEAPPARTATSRRASGSATFPGTPISPRTSAGRAAPTSCSASQTFLDVPVAVDQLFTNGGSGHYLIIAARNETDTCAGVPCEGGDDSFKIQQVVADTPSVPEASTLLLLMTRLAGLAPFARRRR